MENFAEIVRKRSTPGILIFDMDERLVYSNSEAFDIMPALGKWGGEGTGAVSCVPREVLGLCRGVRENQADSIDPAEAYPEAVAVHGGMENPCSLRAFRIGQNGKSNKVTHIMVLVERVIEKHEPDFNEAKTRYGLSKKELEIVRLVCKGCSNQDIGEKLFISVLTVKDHMKNIKRKMCASSRSEIISLLK